MKKLSWSDLKKQPVSDIKKGQCLEITGDGETAFIVVVHPEGAMRAKIEGLCSMIDASRGVA